jgi:hypothetical protein
VNKIQEYFWFIRPDRCFLRLSHDLRLLQPRLNELNERRKKLQIEYSFLRNASHQCRMCHGHCCKETYAPYFSGVDYLIRMFSDKPIDNYFSWWRPRPLIFAVLDKIRSIWSAATHVPTSPRRMCPSLTSTGCVLPPEDRPIRCILWICDDLKKTMPPLVLKKMGFLTRELSSISSEVIRCFENIRA